MASSCRPHLWWACGAAKRTGFGTCETHRAGRLGHVVIVSKSSPAAGGEVNASAISRRVWTQCCNASISSRQRVTASRSAAALITRAADACDDYGSRPLAAFSCSALGRGSCFNASAAECFLSPSAKAFRPCLRARRSPVLRLRSAWLIDIRGASAAFARALASAVFRHPAMQRLRRSPRK